MSKRVRSVSIDASSFKRMKAGPKKYRRGKYAKAKPLIAQIRDALAESKEVLTALSVVGQATVTAAGAYVVLINSSTQGAEYNQHVGRQATHKYVEVDVTIANDGGATPKGDAGFWSIILDRQPNGALAAYSDMYDGSVVAVAGNMFRNTQTNQERFKVIAHEEFAVGPAVTGSIPYRCHRYIDLSKLSGGDEKLSLNATGGGIATIDHGALLFTWGTTLSTATNTSTLTGQSKYRFTDM